MWKVKDTLESNSKINKKLCGKSKITQKGKQEVMLKVKDKLERNAKINKKFYRKSKIKKKGMPR